jgi:RNA polymerase sigma factor for flagellar operon FliA
MAEGEERSTPGAAAPAVLSGMNRTWTRTLWNRYWSTRHAEDRDELVLVYRSIVPDVVARLPADIRTGTDLSELETFGLFGLIHAIERFDEASEISRFRPYAESRIRDAVYDEFRRLDWLPRTIRRRAANFAEVVDDLTIGRGLASTRSEIASSSPRDDRDRSPHPAPAGSDGDASGDWFSSYQAINALVRRAPGDPRPLGGDEVVKLQDALTRLPERQRNVVTLRFLAGLTPKQIGVILNISIERIERLEKAAIESLRGLLREGDGIEEVG